MRKSTTTVRSVAMGLLWEVTLSQFNIFLRPCSSKSLACFFLLHNSFRYRSVRTPALESKMLLVHTNHGSKAFLIKMTSKNKKPRKHIVSEAFKFDWYPRQRKQWNPTGMI